METSYIQQEGWARLVFYISVGAFAVGELSQAVKWRRGASGTDLSDEVVFRGIFFAAILMLPLAQALAPDAVLHSAGVFVLGAIIGWLGLLLRWWSFATLGKYFTTVVKISADQSGRRTRPVSGSEAPQLHRPSGGVRRCRPDARQLGWHRCLLPSDPGRAHLPTATRGARHDRHSWRRVRGLRQGPCASGPLRLVMASYVDLTTR